MKEVKDFVEQMRATSSSNEKVEKLTGGFSYTINEDHVLKTYEKTDLDIIQHLRNELIEKINNYMNIIFQDIS